MNLLKVVFTLTLLLSSILNADEEKEYTTKVLNSIYKNVVLKNTNTALNDIKAIELAVKQKDEKKAKIEFSNFVSSWKSVQGFYILGDLSDDYIDTPRYIDIFHEGNEDITAQLDLILESKDKVEDLIYKNSHKSINAVEYLLYTKDIKDPRVNKALEIATTAIKSHLVDILDGYKEYEESFSKDIQVANAMIINALIESSYKLKEWRIGDIAGFTKKYKGNPDIRRAEYYLSKNSKTAIVSILETYVQVMNSPKYEDYGDYFKNIIKSEQLDFALITIDKTLKLAKQIKNDDITDTKKLYKSMKKLHLAFYIYLIEDLKITAKILDADGD